MSCYRMVRTTTRRKYWMRMTEDERIERILYRAALIIVPFISSTLMFYLWVKMG